METVKSREEIGGVAMITIPGGTFFMGHDYRNDPHLDTRINVYFPDERPVHQVTLTGFQIGETQLTQKSFREVTGRNPSTFTGPDLPVTNIGATEALIFCNALSRNAGLEPCFDEKTGKCDFSRKGFRLPTEAEWEYACRAGDTSTFFYTGNSENDLARAGWYLGNSGGRPHPVGRKEPNSWGLYDMHGNVFEVCYDGYLEGSATNGYTVDSVMNPVRSEEFNYRVMRGGGWFSEPAACRSFTRSRFWTGGGNYYTGFRVARSM